MEIRWRYALDASVGTELAASGWAPFGQRTTGNHAANALVWVATKGGRMAHFKCLACKARVWRDGHPADHLRDLCPGCGGPLDPVARSEDIVGFRALRRRPHARPSIADEVRETIARNDAARISRLRSKEQPDRPS